MDINQKTVMMRFFSNPIVGIFGSLASIIGLFLAIYFYLQSNRHRELVYLVHPAKAVVVKSGQTSRLSVTLDERRVQGDITAAQVAFWNDGNESIRRDHMLKNFVIYTDKGVPIIDARLRKISRDVTRISLDTSRIQAGELGISWSILEPNDGGIVQIVFAGGPDVPISARATLEGQPKITKVGARATKKEPDYKGSTLFEVVFGWVYIGLGTAIIIYSIARKPFHGRLSRFVLGLLMIAMGIFYLVFAADPGPPFGF